MSPKRTKSSRTPRGAQKWILEELQSIGRSASLSTDKISKRIAKASGKSFHKNSVYLALRKLTNQGRIKVTRMGHSKSYSLSEVSKPPKSMPSSKTATVVPASSVENSAGVSHETWPERVAHAAGLPHKLALGEILVLSVSEDHVLVATNLHGRLVFERLPLPK